MSFAVGVGVKHTQVAQPALRPLTQRLGYTDTPARSFRLKLDPAISQYYTPYITPHSLHRQKCLRTLICHCTTATRRTGAMALSLFLYTVFCLVSNFIFSPILMLGWKGLKYSERALWRWVRGVGVGELE